MRNLTKSKRLSTIILLIFLVVISGCSHKEVEAGETKDEESNIQEITRYEGKASDVVDRVYTTSPLMALTFNGVVSKEKMEAMMEKLAEHEMKATFFVSQKQVEENRELIQELSNKGHHIENSVMNQEDLSDVSYEDIYKEVELGNEMIEEITGNKPHFTRTKPWKQNDDLALITAQLNMEAVVGHSIRLRDSDLKMKDGIDTYFQYSLSRGGIISLDVSDDSTVLQAIEAIARETKLLQYSVVPLLQLIENGKEKKSFEEIAGHDLIKENTDVEQETPNLVYSKDTKERVVALTFDDWASDKTVMEVLKILEEYDIKSTFFLKAKGVEKNPNLAKVILDAGHEIANHSYGHHRSTELTPEELQEDLMKAHHVITEAIQEQPTMLFRPPFGIIDEASAKVISAAGFQHIAMYDVSSYDWNPEYAVEDVVNRVVDETEPGSVIVMHILDDAHTIEALPIIIEKLKADGYSFEKMSKWFEE